MTSGCVTSQAKMRDEQRRLQKIYQSAFQQGFTEAWGGKYRSVDFGGLVGKSTDWEAEFTFQQGHRDGQVAGRKARYAQQEEQMELEKQKIIEEERKLEPGFQGLTEQ
jgi:hypothetical protein